MHRPPLTPFRVAAALDAAQMLFEVPPRAILSRSRFHSITPARHAVIAALAEACETTSTDLARRFSRDHTTVLHSIAQARRRAAQDREYAAAIDLIAQEARRS